jgi:hypothetical protein
MKVFKRLDENMCQAAYNIRFVDLTILDKTKQAFAYPP